MKTKFILAQALAFGLITTAQAHAGSGPVTTESTCCHRIEKYKLVERPRHHVIKEKIVVKDCHHVSKHVHKWVNGVLVKDHPKSRNRFFCKHHCA
jgi:hypothetical protein